MRNKIQTLLLMLFVSVCAAAQSTTVSGTVVDAQGMPFPGASVVVAGTTIGTVTDMDGNFSLQVDDAASKQLNITCIGFQSITLPLSGATTGLSVTLNEEDIALDEIVAVGYGTMKKSDLTGSVSSIDNQAIVAKGATSVLGAMQGAVAGVNISQSTGRAGGSMSIQIRGASSINSDTSPLYVVDGVMCDDIDFLNEQDIEKIDILKDASSTAIYGSRATAGVVMITTKGGASVKKDSKATITYDGYYGFAAVSRMPDFQNTEEFYRYRFLKFLTYAGGASSASSGTPVYQMGSYSQMALQTVQADSSSPSVLKEMLANGQSTDWPSLVTQDGMQQNHYIAVNGSTESMRYHMGLGYQELEGVYVGDKETKYSFKGSLDADIKSWLSAGFNINMAKINNSYTSDDAVQEAYRMNPFMSAYDDEGNVILQPGLNTSLGTDGNQFTSSYSPLAYLDNETNRRKTFRLLGNVYLNFKITDGLTFKSTLSPSYTNYTEGDFVGTGVGDSENSASKISKTSFSWTWDNVLTWDKRFKNIHKINLMGLFSTQKSSSDGTELYYTGVREGTLWYNLQSGTYNADDSEVSYSESSMMSAAFRANYSLLDRYMATVTVRWDGSSKFADGNRWGSFPSFALAWRASEESFLRNVDWLTNLKLRASYGITGNNDGIGNYDTQVTVSGITYYPFGSTYYNGTNPSGIVDKELQWEKSKELNIGLDFGFINNRVYGTFDWYNKKSEDLLYDVQLPLEAGGVSMTTNIGSVRNRGVELSLTGVIFETNDFHWEVTANWSKNNNEVLEINGTGDQVLSGSNSNITGSLFVGSPVNNIWGYVYDGVVTDGTMVVPDNEIAQMKGYTPGTTVKQTDYYFDCYGLTEGNPIVRDINGDGSITDDDRTIRDADPSWTGSISTSMTYKGFDFAMSLYTAQDYYVYSYFLNRYIDQSDRGRVRLNQDYYIPAGTLIDCDGVNSDGTYINPVYQTTAHHGSAPFPNNGGSNSGTNNAYYLSAASVVDASYWKVKNITLGYTVPKDITRKFGCERLRVYCTVTNPFVWSDYEGFDPEWASASLKNDGPSTVTWQFGANLKF